MTRGYLQRLASRAAVRPSPLPRVVSGVSRTSSPNDDPFETIAPLEPAVIPPSRPSAPSATAPPRESLREPAVQASAPRERVERVIERVASPPPAPRVEPAPVVVTAPRPVTHEIHGEVAPASRVVERVRTEAPPLEPPRPSPTPAPRPPTEIARPAPPTPAVSPVEKAAADPWAVLDRMSSQLRAPKPETRVETIEHVVAPARAIAAPNVLPPPAAPAMPVAAPAPKLTIGRIRVEVVAPPPAARAPATVSRVVVAAPRTAVAPAPLMSGVFGLGQS